MPTSRNGTEAVPYPPNEEKTVTTRTCCAITLTVLALALPAAARAEEKASSWDATVEKAVAYLRKVQAKDGSWGSKESPGITGIIVTGLLRTGKVTDKDPMIDKALKYIESLIDPKTGHIAGRGAHVKLHNYVTCVNVLALVAANRPAYKAVIKDASKFLRQLQWDEGEGKKEKDDFYGGAGYDSKSRPDLSNTQLFLDALVAAGVPRDDPAFKKAAIFVSRCQNYKSEWNDRPWAGKINDGSFIYTAALGGATKVDDNADPKVGLPGYGSMTYAGVKSLIYCGVDKTDDRVKAALAWLRKNYTLDHNPGMPKVRWHWGLYYYYHTMAKCLDVLGEDPFVDAKKVKHDWRRDITTALAREQRADGSWVNASKHWMEGDPLLVTGYALMTLSHTKPKK
jgi:squalene-hopene/tetraprenyl-beta-curcumene cyclase